MQQGRTAECHCARLVSQNDHPANPLHRRPIRRPA
jgi:hypothetical protein